jgi:hypothetical protein
MGINPTAGYIGCKSCGEKMALKKTTTGNYSGDCDGCGFRHYYPVGTPCHREIEKSMTPYVDPFAPKVDPAAPGKTKPAPAEKGAYVL